MTATYRDLVTLPSALTAYHGLLTGLLLSVEKGSAPALFHCTAGKDRTGWAAAAFLLMLGADEGTVFEDYLQTNADLLPAWEPMLARAEAAGLERDQLLAAMGARPEYLRAAIEQVNESFGSITGYATTGLGLTEADLDRLRQTYLA